MFAKHLIPVLWLPPNYLFCIYFYNVLMVFPICIWIKFRNGMRSTGWEGVSYLCTWCAGEGGRIWDEQEARSNAAACPPGQRTQVHGRLLEATHLLLTLQGLHLVSNWLLMYRTIFKIWVPIQFPFWFGSSGFPDPASEYRFRIWFHQLKN